MYDISNSYTRINCLYNINSIKNLKSILQHGILSKNMLIKHRIEYVDISNPSVQNRRDLIRVPNHRKLHDYANLYFNARNPMLYYLIKNKNIDDLCVLCINKRVLDLPETLVTDRNAASTLAVFETPENAINHLNFDIIFAKYWNDHDPLKKDEQKLIKCAEVLILNKVPSCYIICIKVGTQKARKKLEELNIQLPIYLDKDLFFN
jgi:hypothetical protein